MAFAAASVRPIEGAVATLGVSDRVAFLRKTYAHLGVALIAFAAITGGMMRFATDVSAKYSSWVIFGGFWRMLLVFGLFIAAGMLAQRLALSETSRGLQYVGLGIFVTAFSLLLQPLLWVLLSRFGGRGFFSIISQATVITLAIFIGLTLTVFLTRKDFSFLRGVLTVCTFAALGVIVASWLFGFTLGALFCGAMILLMSGYILYQTSVILKSFPPTAYVAAALMLFSTIATLFLYVLDLLSILRSD